MTQQVNPRLRFITEDTALCESLRKLLPEYEIVMDGPASAEPCLLLTFFPVLGTDIDRLGEWIDIHPDEDVLAVVLDDDPSTGSAALAVGAIGWAPLSAEPRQVRKIVERTLASQRRRRQTGEERNRYKNFLGSAPIGVFELCGGRVSYVNEHLLQMLGYDRGELIGMQPGDLVIPSERPRILEEIEKRQRGQMSSRPNTYHFVAKNGEICLGEVLSRSVKTSDGLRIEGTIRDITLETRLMQLHRVVLELGEVILSEQNVDRILQLVLDTITEHGGFRRAVLSLFDLSIPVPFEGETYKILTSGLTPEERDVILSQPPMSSEERRLAFSEQFRLGPAYYIPHDQTPWSEQHGITGTVSVDGWHKDDYLFIPLRGVEGIIGSISVDDPIDRSAPTVAAIEPVASLANYAALAVEKVYKIKQLQKQKEHLHGLFLFGRELAPVGDVRRLCEIASRRARDDMDYDLCSIWLLDGMKLVQEAVAAKDVFPPVEIPKKGTYAYVEGPGVTRWAFQRQEPVIVPDVMKDKRYHGPRETIRSFMAIPILGRKGSLGVIDVAGQQLAAFGEQDVEVLSALASQLATAIASLRRRELLARIYSFGQRLAASSDRDQIISSTLNFLVEQFDYQLSIIFLSESDGSLSVTGLRGPFLESQFDIGSKLNEGEGVVGWVARHKRYALIDDVTTHPHYRRAFSDTRSELAVPVLFSGNLLGVINVESPQPSFFDEEDRQLLEVVANHLAISLSNLTSQQNLREQAVRDPLTDLFNRHYFNSIISSELNRGDRYGRPMSLMMIDIDGFRAVNNRLGHLKGDEVLREVAKMLRENVRIADRVIRYGGDEFLVFMPETNGREDAEIVADRLRSQIVFLSDDLASEDLTLGLSIGIYTRRPHEDRPLESILEEVDRRMYADKRSKNEQRADEYRC